MSIDDQNNLGGFGGIGAGMAMIGGCLTQTDVVTVGATAPYCAWPWNTYPGGWTYITQPPLVCSGDVHVFPCPHCDTCKCGAATVKRAKKK